MTKIDLTASLADITEAIFMCLIPGESVSMLVDATGEVGFLRVGNLSPLPLAAFESTEDLPREDGESNLHYAVRLAEMLVGE